MQHVHLDGRGGYSTGKILGMPKGVFFPVAAVLLVSLVTIPVVLTLPEVVSCHAEDESYFVKKIDPPSTSNIQPSMITLYETSRQLVVTGNAFLNYNDNLPSVAINGEFRPFTMDDCTEKDVRGQDKVLLCSKLETSVARDKTTTEISHYPFKVTSPVPEAEHPTADVTDSPPCEHELSPGVTVVPPAVIDDAYPPVVCSGYDRPITITGEYFVAHTRENLGEEGAELAETRPIFSFDDREAEFSHTNLTKCTTFTASGYSDAQACNESTVLMNLTGLAANQAFPITVYNPYPLDAFAVNQSAVAVVEPPSVLFVEPPVICLSAPRTITLHGANFLKVDGEHSGVYSVSLADGTRLDATVIGDDQCESVPLPNSSHTVDLCKKIEIDVPQFGVAAGPMEATLIIANAVLPECEQAFASLLYVAPEPKLTRVNPESICQGTQANSTVVSFYADGFVFATYDGLKPAIKLNDVPYTESILTSNCSDGVDVKTGANTTATVSFCQELTIEQTFDDLQASERLGPQKVTVTQPAPISCETNDVGTWNIVGPAKVYSITPSSLCAGEMNVLVLNGSSLAETTRISLKKGSVSLKPAEIKYIDSSRIEVFFEPEGLTDGTWQLIAVNEGAGCDTEDVKEVLVKAKLFVFFVDPPVVYNGIQLGASIYTSGIDSENVASGVLMSRVTSGFGKCSNPSLALQSECESVWNNASCSNQQLASESECTTANSWNGTHCSNEKLTTKEACEAVNMWFDAFCSDPTLEQSVCEQQNEWTNFNVGFCSNPDLTTFLACVTHNRWANDRCSNPLLLTKETCERVNDWTYYLPGTCNNTEHNTYEECLTAGGSWEPKQMPCSNPLLSTSEACLATNTWDGEACSNPTLTNQAQCEANNTWSQDVFGEAYGLYYTEDFTQKGSTVQLSIPAGFSVGDWDIVVYRADDCSSALQGGFKVVAETEVQMAEISPSHVWYGGNSGVKLTALETLEKPAFRSTPRVYLAPSGPEESAGIALRAIVFEGSTKLSGIVQSRFCSDGQYSNQTTCEEANELWTELTPGVQYNVVVINPPPRSEVGVLLNALNVVEKEVPVVDNVEPAYMAGGQEVVVKLYGKHLDVSSVTPVCVSAEGVSLSVNEATAITKTSSTEQSVTITLPSGGGNICQLQVQNEDGASFLYSSVTTTSGSNIKPWTTQDYALLAPRRAPALVVASPTVTTRVAYVVGGDSNFHTDRPSDGYDTVEYAPLAFDGRPAKDFQLQRYKLPFKVSYGEIFKAGRFLYYYGGWNVDSNTPNQELLRAQILNPLQTPELRLSLNIMDQSQESNLKGGLWYYRCSAVFADNSTEEFAYFSGPQGAGETLPSELLSINLPDISRMRLTLAWDPLPGASHYRLYRTAGPNQNADDLYLLYEGNETVYQDTGDVVSFDTTPLPLGHLGQWHVMPQNNKQSRLKFTGQFIPKLSPNNEATEGCYVALGGSTDWEGSNLRTDGKIFCIQMNPPVDRTATEKHIITEEREFVTGLSAVGLDSTLVTKAENKFLDPEQRYLFTSQSKDQAKVYAYSVDVNGTLGTQTEITSLGPNYLADGLCMDSIGGSFFTIGGNSGLDYKDGGGSGEFNLVPPNINNFNNYGAGDLVVPMSEFGCVRENAFLLQAGGTSASEPISSVSWSYCCS